MTSILEISFGFHSWHPRQIFGENLGTVRDSFNFGDFVYFLLKKPFNLRDFPKILILMNTEYYLNYASKYCDNEPGRCSLYLKNFALNGTNYAPIVMEQSWNILKGNSQNIQFLWNFPLLFLFKRVHEGKRHANLLKLVPKAAAAYSQQLKILLIRSAPLHYQL